MKPETNYIPPDMVEALRRVAKTLRELLPPEYGFVFLVVRGGPQGPMTYFSNKHRKDMQAALRKLLYELEMEQRHDIDIDL